MLLRGILTPDECRLLVEEFDAAATKQREDDAFYRGSVGLYQPPSSLPMVPRLEQQLAPVFGELEFENSYLRSYVKGSFLGIHTDRPGLDVTLSVCLEHNFEGEYPLWRGRSALLRAVERLVTELRPLAQRCRGLGATARRRCGHGRHPLSALARFL